MIVYPELIEMHRFNIGVVDLVLISPAADCPLSFFSGFKNKDVAFFHPESKTLIQADLLFNFPCYEQVCVSSPMILFFSCQSRPNSVF